MSLAGHVFDAINRFNQNRELLMSKRERRTKVRNAYIDAIRVQRKRNFIRRIG